MSISKKGKHRTVYPEKNAVHYEIDRIDEETNEKIIKYFNKKSSSVDKIFWHADECSSYLQTIS